MSWFLSCFNYSSPKSTHPANQPEAAKASQKVRDDDSDGPVRIIQVIEHATPRGVASAQDDLSTRPDLSSRQPEIKYPETNTNRPTKPKSLVQMCMDRIGGQLLDLSFEEASNKRTPKLNIRQLLGVIQHLDAGHDEERKERARNASAFAHHIIDRLGSKEGQDYKEAITKLEEIIANLDVPMFCRTLTEYINYCTAFYSRRPNMEAGKIFFEKKLEKDTDGPSIYHGFDYGHVLTAKDSQLSERQGFPLPTSEIVAALTQLNDSDIRFLLEQISPISRENIQQVVVNEIAQLPEEQKGNPRNPLVKLNRRITDLSQHFVSQRETTTFSF